MTPPYYALAYIMRLDTVCCVCACTASDPAHPVGAVVPLGQQAGEVCAATCPTSEGCGWAGLGAFAGQFCHQ